MHTLHWWAVEAEDKEEAFGIVKERLINDDGTNWVNWSDWHVVGGGRWNSEGDGYTNNSNMIISYSESPDEFKARLEWCKTARKDEMNRCLSEIKTDKFISDVVDYISNNSVTDSEQRFSMNNYYLKNATDLLSDSYTPNSYFYDYVEYTAHMGYVEERLDNPERPLIQFLVPIDFHF
jgi:hypothetical protein